MMWILLFVAAVASGACQSLARKASEKTPLPEKSKKIAKIMIVASVVLGVLLGLVAEHSDFDIQDYHGALTMEGFIYYCLKIDSACIVVETLMAGVELAVKDVKCAIAAGDYNRDVQKEAQPVAAASMYSERQKTSAAPPVSQEKIPAWKLVEMRRNGELENQDK